MKSLAILLLLSGIAIGQQSKFKGEKDYAGTIELIQSGRAVSGLATNCSPSGDNIHCSSSQVGPIQYRVKSSDNLIYTLECSSARPLPVIAITSLLKRCSGFEPNRPYKVRAAKGNVMRGGGLAVLYDNGKEQTYSIVGIEVPQK